MSAGWQDVDDRQIVEEEGEAVMESYLHRLESAPGIDWEEESPRFQHALDNVWRASGWNEEADRYAHELARDVTAIPPWKFMERVTLVRERMTERYDLKPEQVVQFQGSALAEIGVMFTRHSKVLMKQTNEMLGVRSRAEPITPEQVARWTKESEALFADSLASVDRFVKQVESSLDAKQRRILRRDVRSLQKRRDYLTRARKRWARGQWRPTDWGMQDDPIQRGEISSPMGDRSPLKGDPPITRWLSYDPSTWFAYVLDLKRCLQLDPGQMTTARSIHVELVERAEQHIETHAAILKAVPAGGRSTHEAYLPIRGLFDELQARLEAMCTTTQRQQEGE